MLSFHNFTNYLTITSSFEISYSIAISIFSRIVTKYHAPVMCSIYELTSLLPRNISYANRYLLLTLTKRRIISVAKIERNMPTHNHEHIKRTEMKLYQYIRIYIDDSFLYTAYERILYQIYPFLQLKSLEFWDFMLQVL